MEENKIPDVMNNPVHRSLATSSWDYPSEVQGLPNQEKRQKALKEASKKIAKSKSRCSKKEEVKLHPKPLDGSNWDPVYGRIPGTEDYQ